jgi:hypothetical protein
MGTDTPAHLLPCGCLRNDEGAHRGDGSSRGPCPDFETVEVVDKWGNTVRWWRPRTSAEEN